MRSDTPNYNTVNGIFQCHCVLKILASLFTITADKFTDLTFLFSFLKFSSI